MRTSSIRRTQLAPTIEHAIRPARDRRPALVTFLVEHQQRTGEARWTNAPVEITVSDRLRRLIPDTLLVGAVVYRRALDPEQPGIPLTAPPTAPEPSILEADHTHEAVEADLTADQAPVEASTPPEPQKTPTVPTPADLAAFLSKGSTR